MRQKAAIHQAKHWGGKTKSGRGRNRTGDLVHAKHTRYQLRHTPGFILPWPWHIHNHCCHWKFWISDEEFACGGSSSMMQLGSGCLLDLCSRTPFHDLDKVLILVLLLLFPILAFLQLDHWNSGRAATTRSSSKKQQKMREKGPPWTTPSLRWKKPGGWVASVWMASKIGRQKQGRRWSKSFQAKGATSEQQTSCTQHSKPASTHMQQVNDDMPFSN